MKKLLLALSVVGMISLTSCGAQENCRGRVDNSKISKEKPVKLLAFNYLKKK